MKRLLVLIAAACLWPCGIRAQVQPDTYELRCRGGGMGIPVKVIEIRGLPQRPETNTALMTLTFVPGPYGAGVDGSGLVPGTCAWLDRPVNDREPREIRFETSTINGYVPAPGSFPDASYISDPERFWSFRVYNTNQGFFRAVAHQPWTRTGTERRSSSGWAERIEQIHPAVLVSGFMAFIVTGWIATLAIRGGTTGWRQLAQRYPAVEPRTDKRIWIGRLWFRHAGYGNLVYVKADETHLHFRMILGLGHPPFSVPWADVSAKRVPHWYWKRLVQFNFAREPDYPFKMLG